MPELCVCGRGEASHAVLPAMFWGIRGCSVQMLGYAAVGAVVRLRTVAAKEAHCGFSARVSVRARGHYVIFPVISLGACFVNGDVLGWLRRGCKRRERVP